MARFADRLVSAIEERGAPCVIGLDPVLDYIPDSFVRACDLPREGDLEERARLIEAYCALTLEAVHDLVPAVKPQMAYFELFGAHGMRALERCVETARELGLLVLLDGKRGDIGSTSQAYAEAYLSRRRRARSRSTASRSTPTWAKTASRPSWRWRSPTTRVCSCVYGPRTRAPTCIAGRARSRTVAPCSRSWPTWSRRSTTRQLGGSGFGSIGAVVGATQAQAARALRERMPHSLFLVPGFGAQGGSLETVRACFTAGGKGAIVNSSRAVMYPMLFGTPRRAASKDGVREAARDFVGAVRGALG